jgi:hypothetical protein
MDRATVLPTSGFYIKKEVGHFGKVKFLPTGKSILPHEEYG